jgi:hypothetical protein
MKCKEYLNMCIRMNKRSLIVDNFVVTDRWLINNNAVQEMKSQFSLHRKLKLNFTVFLRNGSSYETGYYNKIQD